MCTIFDDIEQAVVRATHRVAQPRQLEPAEVAILQPAPASRIEALAASEVG